MGALAILVVEDNVLNQELVRDLLESAGHRVEVADGREAFRAHIETARPDIILMDILLPGTDGTLLLREVRALPRLMSTPVIAVTAQALAGDLERFRAEGFDAVLTKPLDTRTFVADVERYARGGRGDDNDSDRRR